MNDGSSENSQVTMDIGDCLGVIGFGAGGHVSAWGVGRQG